MLQRTLHKDRKRRYQSRAQRLCKKWHATSTWLLVRIKRKTDVRSTWTGATSVQHGPDDRKCLLRVRLKTVFRRVSRAIFLRWSFLMVTTVKSESISHCTLSRLRACCHPPKILQCTAQPVDTVVLFMSTCVTPYTSCCHIPPLARH